MAPDQMQDDITSSPRAVFQRMIQAANRHDLEGMVACYAPDYCSEQPFHPERNFVGPDGVRQNWRYFFATMPDHHIDIFNEVVDGDTIWAELRFRGTRVDGTRQVTRGVTLVRVQADYIVWARLYIETVADVG